MTALPATPVLHITNGDAAVAALRAAGFAEDMLPWRDVLHEGPVPAGLDLPVLSALRARFIASAGWASPDAVAHDFADRDAMLATVDARTETVLWFEHDLYDQLQLLQLLDWFREHPPAGRLSIVMSGDYLGPMPPHRLRSAWDDRRPVSDRQLALAAEAWSAFRAPDPRDIERVLAADTSALPYLAGALRRHLEQFPGATDGVSRSERQALAAFAGDPVPLGHAFREVQHAEEAQFLGDMTFASSLTDLASEPAPLLRLTSDESIDAHPGGAARDWWGREATLTREGAAVLRGELDRLSVHPIDRWLGGVRLRGTAAWRWDPRASALVEVR